MEDIAGWLANDAPHETVQTLFNAFCRKIACGVPVSRSSIGLEVLHPEVSGWQHVWTNESLTLEASDRATAPTSQSYLFSPTRVVDETEQPFRRLLDRPCTDMPLLEALRLDGATDYIMYPLPFLNRTRTAVISFATLRPGGFDQESLHFLEGSVKSLSPYLERHVLQHIAIDLLDTYVGPHTGQRIIEGRVERGAFELIDAAILFADLRGFTQLSEHSAIPSVLDYLNSWFGSIGEVVEANGGEILKFMGDAVLAIFPTSEDTNRARACQRALTAAQEMFRRTEADNARRASLGLTAVMYGVALHVGEVAYGNVGAARRLDFTVIGPAVNRASRLLDLAKRLDQEIVVSHALAREVNRPLIELGRFRLRGVAERQRVFTLLRS